MARPPADPAQLDLGLALRRPRVGRVERRVAAACRRRRRDGALTAGDDGLVALAVELARTVDVCQASAQPYALAQAGRVLADVEAQLAARAGGTGSAFDAFLAGLSAESGHGPGS